jgi:hypothetical protein
MISSLDGVWLLTEFGLEIEFIDHFDTRLVIINNYNAIANLRILQFTVTHTLVLSVCYSLHQSFPGNGF